MVVIEWCGEHGAVLPRDKCQAVRAVCRDKCHVGSGKEGYREGGKKIERQIAQGQP